MGLMVRRWKKICGGLSIAAANIYVGRTTILLSTASRPRLFDALSIELGIPEATRLRDELTRILDNAKVRR
jgi:hypothetical protein